MNLFGEPTKEKQKIQRNRVLIEKPVQSKLLINGHLVPMQEMPQAWAKFNFIPQINQLVHFNVGVGFDLGSKQKRLFPRVLGYILSINLATTEILVHLPKSLVSKVGDDEYFISSLFDVLPIESIPEFDAAEYRRKRPLVPYPFEINWQTIRKV